MSIVPAIRRTARPVLCVLCNLAAFIHPLSAFSFAAATVVSIESMRKGQLAAERTHIPVACP